MRSLGCECSPIVVAAVVREMLQLVGVYTVSSACTTSGPHGDPQDHCVTISFVLGLVPAKRRPATYAPGGGTCS